MVCFWQHWSIGVPERLGEQRFAGIDDHNCRPALALLVHAQSVTDMDGDRPHTELVSRAKVRREVTGTAEAFVPSTVNHSGNWKFFTGSRGRLKILSAECLLKEVELSQLKLWNALAYLVHLLYLIAVPVCRSFAGSCRG
jgi:hypothetical protein